MIKSLKKNDIRTTPFTAAKTWNPQNKLHKDLILWQSGSVSGSLSLTFKEFNDGTISPYTYISSAIALQQQEDDFLRFREGVNLSGSISPTGSFYYDPILSEKNIDGTYKTVLYATTKHLFYKESQDPTKIFGLESLDSSNVNRSLPNKISTFNIPQNKFGEKVIPNTVEITHEIQGNVYKVLDDGNSNLVISDKTFINNQDANIDKIPANIILNNLTSEVYDGDPYEIGATTKPSNLAYIVTYNGSTTPPTDAGTYTIIATINDNFYYGSATGTFIIEKAERTINVSNLSQTYDGNPKSVTVSIVGVNVSYTVTYNGFTTPPTDAGKYKVVVTIDDKNYKGSKTVELNVAGKMPSITSLCPIKTYGDPDFDIPINSNSNGSISYTINSGPAVIKKGKISITDIGTIDVTVNQAASGNYIASSVNCSITVNQKPLTVVGITANNKSYDGNNTATLNTTNKQLVGVVTYSNGTSDIVTLDGTAIGTFSDANVGEGKTVTISGLTISGTDSSKYTLIQPNAIASIKSNTGSGTITISDKLVTYDGTPKSLDVSINDTNIPIKITYTRGNNIITLVKLYHGITTISQGQYPKDIGIYNIKAELDNDISTTIKYTVSTVNATLNITSQISNVVFGPNIFYYDGQQKQLQILSKTPSNLNLYLTYIGFANSFPSEIGTYNVKVFSDSNFAYNQTKQLIIKSIPTNSCGTNITNETTYQQYQKNIIDLTSAVGKVNFNYSVGLGASQFTIEYPLNSGNIVYDSGLRSKDNAVNAKIVDYVSKNTVTVTGIQNPENNKPISFTKDKTGINSDNGQNYDKCLITVYSPTNNNTWNYSISCVDVVPPIVQPLPGIDDLKNVSIDLSEVWPINDFSAQNARLGTLLLALVAQLKVQLQGGSITQYEYNAIERIIRSNISLPGGNARSYTLTDTDSNIKIIVSKNSGVGEYTEANLKYQRVSNSLSTQSNFGPFVFDCHLYKYKGKKPIFDITEAVEVLKSQINSDTFQDTFISLGNNISNGEIQRKYLLKLVTEEQLLSFPQSDNVLISFSNIVTKAETDILGILSDALLYINQSTQEIQIVYPAICQPINFGQH